MHRLGKNLLDFCTVLSLTYEHALKKSGGFFTDVPSLTCAHAWIFFNVPSVHTLGKNLLDSFLFRV